MRYKVSLTQSNPKVIGEPPFSAEYMTVLNNTANVVYVNVGSRIYPDSQTYDYMVPAGSSMTIPVSGNTFAFTLFNPLGVNAGISGYTSRADIVLIAGETAPQISGFSLPSAPLSFTGTIVSSTNQAKIVDVSGFTSLYFQLSGSQDLGITVETGPTANGPWAFTRAWRVLSTNPLTKVIPSGGGFIRFTIYNNTGSDATYSLYYRPYFGSSANTDTRYILYTNSYYYTSVFGGYTFIAANIPVGSGIIDRLSVQAQGYASPPYWEFTFYDYGTKLLNFNVAPGQKFYAGSVGTYYPISAGEKYLQDGGSDYLVWDIPVNLPFSRSLILYFNNLTVTVPNLQVSVMGRIEN